MIKGWRVSLAVCWMSAIKTYLGTHLFSHPRGDVHFLFQFRGHEVRGIGRDGHVVVEGLESDHWLALDIGK